MSWSTSPADAAPFAEWYGPEGLLFTTVVPPEAVLAQVGTEGGRNENEVVVDPAMLPPLGRSAIFTPQ